MHYRPVQHVTVADALREQCDTQRSLMHSANSATLRSILPIAKTVEPGASIGDALREQRDFQRSCPLRKMIEPELFGQ